MIGHLSELDSWLHNPSYENEDISVKSQPFHKINI